MLESFFAIKPDGEISSQGFSWKSRLKFDWKARLEEEQDKAWARKPGPKLKLNYNLSVKYCFDFKNPTN